MGCTCTRTTRMDYHDPIVATPMENRPAIGRPKSRQFRYGSGCDGVLQYVENASIRQRNPKENRNTNSKTRLHGTPTFTNRQDLLRSSECPACHTSCTRRIDVIQVREAGIIFCSQVAISLSLPSWFRTCSR